jgi:hypothetical protein
MKSIEGLLVAILLLVALSLPACSQAGSSLPDAAASPSLAGKE